MRLFEGTPFDRPPRCEKCDQLEEECICPPEPSFRIPPEQQTARLSIEKRKKGKRVTVIRGLPAEGNDLPELLKQIKDRCGAGGALKDEDLEIQGEQLDRVRETLQQMGFKVKG
ncbi:translation initiation factor Sui1 [Gimesia chilikensis]|uniref:Translation initiation factor Sui1 n=1 Tax=Gimesia chilikensis TaxID=2605989 RepID=A0A517WE83_9PLAN|nr:translation initiation factor [Gimesia chilikensis]QDU03570.1 translation initiation factor Sui1 [Gimesia chilikensis]